jgi:hypothetical protein
MFHDERVAMRSLQRSSSNSCCRGGFHILSTRFDEPSGAMVKLETLDHFMGRSIFSIGVDNERGLSIGDDVAEVIEFEPVAMAKRGRLAECSNM